MRNTTFKHTSRSFYDLYKALKAAYPNKPDWLFTEQSGQFDFQSEMMNAIATDILDPFTRESAYGFAARNDYSPVEADGATVSLTFTLAQSMSKTLAAGYQVGGISTANGKLITYELTQAGSVVSGTTITVNAKQKKTITGQSIGLIANADDFIERPIDGYTGILKDSISLTIQNLVWTRVDDFDTSTSTDRHFVLIYQSKGKARVQFGNGVNGKKPTVGAEVFATFAVTEGLNGRMAAGEINLNLGADTDVASVTNASATSGGNDSESISSILRNARANVRLRNAVWSQEDLETAARAASSSVQKALGIPGTGTAVIHIIPSGGGTPSGGLKTAVETYVEALTQFGVMPITVSDPNYVSVAIAATVTIRSGFTGSTVRDLTEFALTLVSSPIDNEVIEYFEDNGVNACRENVINVIWSWAFTEDENEALEFIIQKWISMLGDRSFREWGQPLEVGDLWVMGNSLYDYGVDIFDLTTPTTNQTATSTQIIEGTATVT